MTTFRILLPLAEQRDHAQDKHARHGLQLVPDRPTIMLVEDEEAIRQLVTRSLRAADFSVISCPNGLAALNALEQFSGKLDLLVTDVVMPYMGGWELARELRARIPGLKILFCSGYSDDEAALRSNNEMYLQKPYSISDLLGCIGGLVRAAPPHAVTQAAHRRPSQSASKKPSNQ